MIIGLLSALTAGVMHMVMLVNHQLTVEPLPPVTVTEPSDLQPALGYRVWQATYNPQGGV